MKKAQTPQVDQLTAFKTDSGWSVYKMAKLMDIHPQTLVYWLNGTHSPSNPLKRVIASFLEAYSYKHG